MRVRQDPVTLFSSFLVFRDNRSVGWVIDPALRRNMLSVVLQPQQTWESYWYARYLERSSPLPAQHLCAYLQSACYSAARRIALNFPSSTHNSEDLFQAAILQTERILERFNPALGYPLNHYASSVFESAVRQTLREQKDVAICTNCSLLRSTSQKRLRAALTRRGLNQERLHYYVRAWQSFKLVYVPDQSGGTRALNWPNLAQWTEILRDFNRSLPPAQQLDSVTLIEEWMQEIAVVLREYLCPSTTSLNQTPPGFEKGDLLDILIDETDQNGLDALIANEEEHYQLKLGTQINNVLLTAVNCLEPKLLTLLQYAYTDGYTQTHIGKLLGEQQYTICRWLDRVHKSLLSSLAQWSQQHLHISLNLDVLETMGAHIKEWLKNHFNTSRPS